MHKTTPFERVVGMIRRYFLSAGVFFGCLLVCLIFLCAVPDKELGNPALFRLSVWVMSTQALLGVVYSLLCVYAHKTGVVKETNCSPRRDKEYGSDVEDPPT